LLFPTIINNQYFSWLFEKRGVYNYPTINGCPSKIGESWPETYSRIQSIITSYKDAKMDNKKQLKIGKIVNHDEVLCRNGWGNVKYCVELHHQFLNDLESNDIEKYKMGLIELVNRDPVSISCCSWIGSTLRDIVNQVGDVFDDEPWWCVWMPTWLSMCNAVYGDCIVAHYAYYKQRELGLDYTDVLVRYNNLK
jgi:hypothetical protein